LHRAFGWCGPSYELDLEDGFWFEEGTSTGPRKGIAAAIRLSNREGLQIGLLVAEQTLTKALKSVRPKTLEAWLLHLAGRLFGESDSMHKEDRCRVVEDRKRRAG
jgi:predicted Zn-dependent protease